MIINRPTGTYRDVLPKFPEDSTSVVFTISNTTPPRSLPLGFTQIPDAIKLSEKPVRIHDEKLRRANLGQLVFVSKTMDNSKVSTGNQLYYPGQVFDFVETQEDQSIVLVDSGIETQHDQYVPDNNSVGVSDEEMSVINDNAVEAQRVTLDGLNSLQLQLNDTNADIVTQQKTINEANRIIDGLQTILISDPDDEDIQQSLETVNAKLIEATAELASLVEVRNSLPAKIRDKQDELRALARLIQ